MKLQLEIIKEIIRLGSKNYPSITDPSESALLKNAGVAPVTAHIEKLSLSNLVKDAQPLFGKNGGMWIGYSLSDKGFKCGTDEKYLMRFYQVLMKNQ